MNDVILPRPSHCRHRDHHPAERQTMYEDRGHIGIWFDTDTTTSCTSHTSRTSIELKPQDKPVSSLTFLVDGLTCSSCESSLKDTLMTIGGVDMASVSVVLGRAVIEGTVDAELIIRVVSQKTGFKLSLVGNKPVLYLRFARPVGDFPAGVEAKPFGKTVQFNYNPIEISAREIFDFYAKAGLNPTVVAEPTTQTPIWNTLGCRVIVSILLSIPVIVLAYLPPRPILYGAIQLSLVTVILAYVISPLYKSALSTLFHRGHIEMDLLVVMSTSIAYAFSVVSYAFICFGEVLSEAFWETPAMLVTLIMFGRWITVRARERAVKTVKEVSATNVKTVKLDCGRVVDVALVGYNDIIIVDPGETIPTDGILVRGDTEVSEAMFTGEAHAKPRIVGSTVFAGSVNLISQIAVRVTKLPSENALAGIRQLIDTSQINKPRIQTYTDRVAGYLGPIALMAAITALLTWFFVGWKLQGLSASTAAINGLTYAISVLAISCPCTIGLAVPMNVVIASGIAASRGILIKDTHALEILHRVKSVVFDKTGTITKGKPAVVDERIYVEGARDLVKRLVSQAAHPIAKAVSRYLGDAEPFEGVQMLVGRGLQAKCEAGEIKGGSAAWLEIDNPLAGRNLSTFCVVLDGKLIAVYGLADELRAESVNVVKALHARGVQVHLLSGDNTASALSVGKKLGIPLSNIRSNALPVDKANYVREIQSTGPVLFCGDGINDAPALSAADVGISFVSAAEITSSSAKVLLLSDDLWSVPEVMQLSRRVYRRIIVNFVWSGIYNFIAIALAAGVLVVWRIEPRWAGLGEIVSVMPVVIVGWSLKWNRNRRKYS